MISKDLSYVLNTNHILW